MADYDRNPETGLPIGLGNKKSGVNQVFKTHATTPVIPDVPAGPSGTFSGIPPFVK